MSRYPNATKSKCLACGVLFSVAPSKLARGGGKTCSTVCRRSVANPGRVLEEMPGTAKQIALRSGIAIASVRDNIGKMILAGKCHVSGFEPNEGEMVQGMPTFAPVLSVGPSTDPDMPNTTREAVTYYMRKITLDAMPGTISALSIATGIPGPSTLRIVTAARKKKLCFIGRWQRATKGDAVPVFVKGEGKDAVNKVKKFTRAEVNRRHRKKLRTDPELADKREEALAKGRARYWENKALTQGDPLHKALFGK